MAAAKKLCDYVIGEIGPNGRRGRELWQTGNWSGYASSSILEPVVWLYRRVAARDGRDAAQKYLDCDYASAGNTWTRANFYRTWFPVEYGPAQ